MHEPEIREEKKVMAYLELYKAQMEHFRSTVQIEWRLTFSAWTLLVALTYVAATQGLPLRGLSWILFLVPLVHVAWLILIHRSEEADKSLWVSYRGRALELMDPGTDNPQPRSLMMHGAWILVEFGITVILTLVALRVINQPWPGGDQSLSSAGGALQAEAEVTRSALDWVLLHPEAVAAGSTVIIALFAGVQVGIEWSRRRDHKRASESKAVGLAWLARRNCEAALVQAVGETSAYQWRRVVATRESLDAMQENMLAMLAPACEAGGRVEEAARTAFSGFLAFADAVTDDKPFVVSFNVVGDPKPTAEEREEANTAVRAALNHLRVAIGSLERVAPRHSHEAVLPSEEQLPVLGNSIHGPEQVAPDGGLDN